MYQFLHKNKNRIKNIFVLKKLALYHFVQKFCMVVLVYLMYKSFIIGRQFMLRKYCQVVTCTHAVFAYTF